MVHWQAMKPSEKAPRSIIDTEKTEPTPKLQEQSFDPSNVSNATIFTQKYQVTIHVKENAITVLNKKGDIQCRKISIKTLMALLKTVQGN